MAIKYGKMVSAIVKKYKKSNRDRTCSIRKADKKTAADPDTATLKPLMDGIREWQTVCKRINDVAHLVGAELDEQGFPCSVSIQPVFHPDTHQTYSSEVKFVLSRMQLNELIVFYKGKNRPRTRGLCRDEICTMALAQADHLLFEENLKARNVTVTRHIAGNAKALTVSFDDLTDKKIASILGKFIRKVFMS